MVIPGSEYLSKILHVASQSFLIPCIIGLILFLVLSLMELGSFAAELRQRKNLSTGTFLETFQRRGEVSHWWKQNLQQAIEESHFSPQLKQALEKLAAGQLGSETKNVLAREILDSQEIQAMKTLETTDLIAKLGPVLGLMGTLIPLGPGLAALGQGNLNALAQAVIVAFDTTVVGIAAGGIAFLISKVRRRWYEKDLNNLEVFLELILGGEDCEEENKVLAVVRGRT